MTSTGHHSPSIKAPRLDEGRTRQLEEFVQYVKSLNGDEKGEAQVFIDRLFRAFSRVGYHEAGATLEMRLKNDRGGTAFADLVWKPIVLIEMKRRGQDLSRHLAQAFDYWVRLVPNRPRYVVLCNFDEFRIFDFDKDINKPQDVLPLEELPRRYGPLNFLWPTNEDPFFKVDREKATREAADILANVYRNLKGKPAVGPATAQRFVLQALVCLFSEDIGLLPKHFFTQLLRDCVDPPRAFDLLDGLFRAMNQRHGTRHGRFQCVDYFNGGIFSEPAAVELDPGEEGALLLKATEFDWSGISPDIFGTIFQHSMDTDARHALGAHFTSQPDIMKVVGPTLVTPFRTAMDACETLRELADLQRELQSLRVLDPACGSGNFLYVAYREMRRIEADILNKQHHLSRRQVVGQMGIGGVSPRQFFGMDVVGFAVELAKVTLSLAPKLASDELHTSESTLPLNNLDENIRTCDALIDARGERTVWPTADCIIGNPPFLGSRKMKPERGHAYVESLRAAYPELSGNVDYCVYWFRRANDHLEPVSPLHRFRGRAGLVGTQNVRNGESRKGGLDEIARTGSLVEAVEVQPWSGEANVHVSIANWVKLPNDSTATSDLLIPAKKKIWSPVIQPPGGAGAKKRASTGIRRDKHVELEVREVDTIGATLSSATDVTPAVTLACNSDPKRFFQGITPGHAGFLITPALARGILRDSPHEKEIIHPYLIGRELLSNNPTPNRYLIDFEQRTLHEAMSYPHSFAIVQREVMETRQAKAKREDGDDEERPHHQRFLKHWWRLSWGRPELVRTITAFTRYIVCSRVTKRPVFAFVDSSVRPGDALQVFAFQDDYSFGILQSSVHCEWFEAKRSNLKSDPRYKAVDIFGTFPWPQLAGPRGVARVADLGRELRSVRARLMNQIGGGLRDLYRSLELPGDNQLRDAHAALDEAVVELYGFRRRSDVLGQLLRLNLEVGTRINTGQAVSGPGSPLGADSFLSSDRFGAPNGNDQ